MSSTPLARFGELYEARPDPWNTSGSWYEQRKRDVALACLPNPTYGSAIEPACGTGELTAALAPRCEHLEASDGVDAAVQHARQRARPHPHVSVSRRTLPAEFPHERACAELVVLSEILYYLGDHDFEAVVDGSVRALLPGGDLLAVHWRPRAEDAPSDGDSAHRRLRERPEFDAVVAHRESEFLADVLRLR